MNWWSAANCFVSYELQPMDPDALAAAPQAMLQAMGRRSLLVFPTLTHPAFGKSLRAGWFIEVDGQAAGVILHRTPAVTFIGYGEKETILAIWPEYRRRGIGGWALKALPSQAEQMFAIVSHSNPPALGLLRRVWRELEINNTRYSAFRPNSYLDL